MRLVSGTQVVSVVQGDMVQRPPEYASELKQTINSKPCLPIFNYFYYDENGTELRYAAPPVGASIFQTNVSPALGLPSDV